MALGFFPIIEAANENEEELEIVITREGDRSLGSDVTLRLVFLPPPDTITDDDAMPGKNMAISVSVRHCASVFLSCFGRMHSAESTSTE